MSTRQPISSVILSESTSSVSFINIPQTYTDLYLVVSGNSAGGYINTRIRFNSDTGSSYSFTRLGVTFPGNNATLSAGSEQNATSIRGAQMDNADNQFFTVNIMSYTNTNINKTVLVKTYNSDGGGYGDSPTVVTGLWRNTDAVSSIIITTDGTSFASNTTFNLYGIDSSLSAQAKATGGSSIYTDGSYWYHIFNTSGTFIPTENLTADYLVVAGGGGGGNTVSYTFTSAGGGGAGGLRSTVTATGGGGSLESALSLTAQAYTVTVGAGGAGATTFANRGATGSNSVFSTITSNGGGGGAGNGDEVAGSANGGNGGSGGGAMSVATNTGSGGTPQSGQGFRGGNGIASYSQGAGGGGAGAIGGDQVSGGAKNGGAGVAVAITGSSVTYAGGGGGGGYYLNQAGGSGGAGGGGNGATAVNGGTANPLAQAGGTNLGGGGGGGSSQQGGTSPGGNGGSGVVVIRYAV